MENQTLRNLSPPFYYKEVWDYKKLNVECIQKAIWGGVIKTLLTIYDGTFNKNSWWFLTI